MKVIIEHTEEEDIDAFYLKSKIQFALSNLNLARAAFNEPPATLTTRITDKHGAFIQEEK